MVLKSSDALIRRLRCCAVEELEVVDETSVVVQLEDKCEAVLWLREYRFLGWLVGVEVREKMAVTVPCYLESLIAAVSRKGWSGKARFRGSGLDYFWVWPKGRLNKTLELIGRVREIDREPFPADEWNRPKITGVHFMASLIGGFGLPLWLLAFVLGVGDRWIDSVLDPFSYLGVALMGLAAYASAEFLCYPNWTRWFGIWHPMSLGYWAEAACVPQWAKKVFGMADWCRTGIVLLSAGYAILR